MAAARFPLQIGITGGIGSGKSIICKLFACLDVPVYNADSRAKWLTTHSSEIKNRITELLGGDAYTSDGEYNRTYVASKVFNDPELLSNLNSIIHPAVLTDTSDWVKKHSSYRYVIKEAAIMNRAGDRNELDFVVVVEAPMALRIERILQRDRREVKEIKSIIDRQVSDEQRRKIADFTIQNDESSALIPQVLELHRKFVGMNSGNF